jgi:hypothetical protein
MKKLRIDEMQLDIALVRDFDFHDIYPKNIYLDLETGEILHVYDSDFEAGLLGVPEDANKKDREKVGKNPEFFLRIVGLSHGQHHEILKKYIRTYAKSEKDGGYFGSIGGWKELASEEDWKAFEDFREKEYHKIIKSFLAENGIEPEWY